MQAPSPADACDRRPTLQAMPAAAGWAPETRPARHAASRKKASLVRSAERALVLRSGERALVLRSGEREREDFGVGFAGSVPSNTASGSNASSVSATSLSPSSLYWVRRRSSSERQFLSVLSALTNRSPWRENSWCGASRISLPLYCATTMRRSAMASMNLRSVVISKIVCIRLRCARPCRRAIYPSPPFRTSVNVHRNPPKEPDSVPFPAGSVAPGAGQDL